MATAREFGQRPDPGHPEELVRGTIVRLPISDRQHGFVCNNVGRILGDHLHEHDLGRVIGNGSGLITERDPDTVRGADVAYYSYARLPRGPLPTGYGPEVPELVVEVCSAGDRWIQIQGKVAEYLRVGVLVVVVLDPKSQTAHVFTGESAPVTLKAEDDLILPGLLEGFRVRVGRFFE